VVKLRGSVRPDPALRPAYDASYAAFCRLTRAVSGLMPL
jgi:hypothetical protein